MAGEFAAKPTTQLLAVQRPSSTPTISEVVFAAKPTTQLLAVQRPSSTPTISEVILHIFTKTYN